MVETGPIVNRGYTDVYSHLASTGDLKSPESRRAVKDGYVCDALRTFAFGEDILTFYFSALREFCIAHKSYPHGSQLYLPIKFCPFCGTVFPPSLREQWMLQARLRLESELELGDFANDL